MIPYIFVVVTKCRVDTRIFYINMKFWLEFLYWKDLSWLNVNESLYMD